METYREFRAAAESCRVLASSMANPDEVRKLMGLAEEFDALADADEAGGLAASTAAGRNS